jgi:hypothetical protein
MEPLPPSVINTTVVTREALESQLFESFASRDQEVLAQEKNREKRRKQEEDARGKIEQLQEKLVDAPKSAPEIEKRIEKVQALFFVSFLFFIESQKKGGRKACEIER